MDAERIDQRADRQLLAAQRLHDLTPPRIYKHFEQLVMRSHAYAC